MPAASEPSAPDRAARRSDAISTLASLLFITWCFVVGTLLLYAPWMPVWARITASFSDPTLQQILAHPTLRGAICGFGLFHLVYGTHDLDAAIARFLHRRQEKVETAAERTDGAAPGEAANDPGGHHGGDGEEMAGGPAGEGGSERPGDVRRGEP